MGITYGKSILKLDTNLIFFKYGYEYIHTPSAKKWELTLNADQIIYSDLKTNKKKVFSISDIKEFQFEVDGNHRDNQLVFASAYIISKTDPDPVSLFTVLVHQNFIYTNQTKAFEFCSEALTLIGEKYSIPWSYKLSIDTKEKRRVVWLLPIVFIIIVIMLILRLGILNK